MLLSRLIIAATFTFAIAAAPAASAQAVTPPIVEYAGGAAEGSFEVSNTTLQTLYVTLEPKSFNIDRTGRAIFRSLDGTTHVDLSEKSLRLPPQQKRTVFYRASAMNMPAWFCIYANFSGAAVHKGMTVQIELPHTVYLLGKAKSSREEIVLRDLYVKDNHLFGIAENRGNAVTRVLGTTAISAHGKKIQGEGFPLLPHGVREFSIDLGNSDAVKVTAKIDRFEITAPVAGRETIALNSPAKGGAQR